MTRTETWPSESAPDSVTGDWADLLTNAVPPVPLAPEGNAAFYRLIGQ